MWHAIIVPQSASLITSAIQLQNLAGTSTSKSWTNLETLSSKSEQKLNFMTKVNLPNLHQTVVNMFLIINFNNSNNFNKSWVAIFTHQGHINQVYLTAVSQSVSQSVSDKYCQWSDSGPINSAKCVDRLRIPTRKGHSSFNKKVLSEFVTWLGYDRTWVQ